MTYICTPILYQSALWSLIFSANRKNTVVYFEILPRYLRGVCRLLKISPDTVAAFISRISGLSLKRIDFDKIRNFSQIHLASMEKVTAIAQTLMNRVQDSPWTQRLAGLIGAQPALAYSLKYLSQELFPQVLVLATCQATLANPGDIVMIWHPRWPQDWQPVLQRHFPERHFRFFSWPRWYTKVLELWDRIRFLVKLPVITASYLLRRGIINRPVAKRKFFIMTEFIDPQRLNGTAYDADFWVDNRQVKKNDIIFFLTRRQQKTLKSDGYAPADLITFVEKKGYNLKIIDKLPLPRHEVKHLLSIYLDLIKSIPGLTESLFSRAFEGAWDEYLEFVPLFHYYDAKNLIYLTFPNGHTGLRFNDAVLTGLCREHGVRSVGCQTRSIYAAKFEDCFDCYDLYLSWGPAWREKMPDRLQFVKQVVDVGCIYLDYLIPILASKQQNRPPNDKVVVAIFDSDIHYNHHYTKDYTTSFFKNCAKLAQDYPGCHFLVKNKVPINARIIMEDEEFSTLWQKVEGNLEFTSWQQYDYAEIMAQADIVIAIAFTTPGVEGLLLGKPALYYSELQCGGQAFSGSANLVAGNFLELEQWFARALVQVRQGYVPDNRVLDELSAFRDGRARSRIVEILEG